MMPFHYPTATRLDSKGRSGYTARTLAAEEGTIVPIRLITRVLALLVALLLPGFANAHAILENSTPGIGASVKPGPLDLRLRYNSRIDRARSRLTLIRADHSRETVAIAPGGPPDIIAAHLDVTPGLYVLHWQVLAVDGHITRGDLPFTVTAP
jgi:methionine-rich copper-binding protein CopC